MKTIQETQLNQRPPVILLITGQDGAVMEGKRVSDPTRSRARRRSTLPISFEVSESVPCPVRVNGPTH